jgi:hypothetical protein
MEARKVQPSFYVWLAIIAVFVVGWLYTFFSGNPEAKRFRDECYRQQTRSYPPGSIPDVVIENAVAYCERELRKHLGLR